MEAVHPCSSLTPLLLDGVRDTGRRVGRGATASVKELDFRGLKCVGKVIHGVLVDTATREERTALLRRFEEECTLLSRLHHPCIVQFMGVFYEDGSDLPVLVMEYLHFNLSTCLERHGVLSKEISYGILRDVATGLRYLHEQPQPIIHRDLSANNVLLTSNMNAKISDLGVAKILDLTPAQVSQMTQAPGTPCYMPPEALMTKPKYTAKIDSYSYGVLMIHTLCGQWPYPTDAFRDDPSHPGTLVPVSEVDRRAEYLVRIADKHPDLLGLIHRCLSNTPDNRPSAFELLTEVASLHSKMPALFTNRVQVMERLEMLEAKNNFLAEQNHTLATKKEELRAVIEYQLTNIDALELQLQRNRSLSQPESLLRPQQPHLFDPQAKLQWRACASIPIGMTGAQAVVIQHQVYVGGSVAGNRQDLHLVFRYDPKQETWVLLPTCPVRFFGMSHYTENLVTVGGKHQDGSITGKVYRCVFKEKIQIWKEFLKPMQIPRAAPSVISTSTALIACGGAQGSDPIGCTFVEVFSDKTSQWHLTDPLPMPCHFMSAAVISDTCYLLGGRGGAGNDDINSVLCASVASLLRNAAPQIKPRQRTATIWEKLTDTPLKRSTAASLSGCLLAVGGYDDRKSQAIHVYLPFTNSWVRMWNCDLPSQRWGCTAVELDGNKVLIISGRDNQDMRTNTVFEGFIYM